MVSYGDTQYTWDYGKSLSSVKGDGKSYYYKYDENGIRTSKTVNGKTTRFNTLGGAVLAQSDSSGIMYFQYDNAGAPIGFVYNDVQYLYITNISGDIAGITDAQGNLLAEYTYDAWGKLLDITTAEEGNEEQLSLANANPLRYRGYYYDNETGYYYLQSRYYNPEWGRFISADGFAYLDTQNGFSLNAYIYCWDCPTIFEDAEGTTPTISIDISKIQAFVVKIQVFTSNVKNKLTEFGNRILASLQDTIDQCKQLNEKIKCKFTALGEKIKFKLHNFNISINKVFKEITGRDLNIFKIVEFIIERVHNDENDEQSTSVRKAKKSGSVTEEGKIIGIVITEIFTCWDLQVIAKKLHIDFSFTDLADYMQKKVDIYRQYFDSIIETAAKKYAADSSGFISTILGMLPNLSIEKSAAISALPYFTNLINDYSGRYITNPGATFMALFDISIGGIVDGGGKALEILVSPIISILFMSIADDLYGIDSTRQKAEFLAYNWYYFLVI